MIGDTKFEDLLEDVKTKIVCTRKDRLCTKCKIMARKPDEFRGFCTYYDAIMETECNITKAELEMIVVATCTKRLFYCVFRGAVLRIRSKDKIFQTK